jgi:low temperature requirement protein LtrA
MKPMPDPDESSPSASLLRNHRGGHAPVSYLELFFDLVYVFAITQVSHVLLKHLSWTGLIEAATLFFAVWWAWMYTTWATNWADPERVPIRLMLLLAMLASLIMAAAMPHAFVHGPERTAMVFAASYVGIQLLRSMFMAWVMRRGDHAAAMSMVRIACWFAVSAIGWFGGALSHSEGAQLALWLGALAVEYLGPISGYRTPGLGRADPADWQISGSHMAERCALFIIIALGEGVIVTGASFSEMSHGAMSIAAFLLAFFGSVLMWWIYFDVGAERGARHIEHHAEPGRIARSAYTYLHMPIVAGVVITAVADGLLLEHPQGMAGRGLILTQSAGLLTYLAGTGLFKRFGSPLGNYPLSHLVGCGLVALIAAWAWWIGLSALTFIGGTVAVMVLVALWEWGSFHGGWSGIFGRKQAG